MKIKWKLRRPLCILVSCVMLLSMIPTTAWAEDAVLLADSAESTVIDANASDENDQQTEDALEAELTELDPENPASDAAAEKEIPASAVVQPEQPAESAAATESNDESDAAKVVPEEENVQPAEDTALEQEPAPLRANSLPQSAPRETSIPPETCTVDYSKGQSDSISYDGYEYDEAEKVYRLYYTIHENAGENVVIDLTQCASAVQTVMPGVSYKFQLILQNESGKIYRYKDNSFVVAPGDTSDYGSLEEGSLLPVLTYDGQYMPISLSGAMIPYYFYEDVFGVNSTASVTFDMMCRIYEYLAKQGYTGDTAITDYMLDYCNAKRNTNYSSLTELFADHPEWLDGEKLTSNGIWTMSQAELEKYIEKYPWIDRFVSVTPNGNMLKVQIKWPEPELAAVSYNSLYMGLFSFVYGKENVDTLKPIGDGITFSRAHCVGDYMSGTDLYKETNAYFESLTDTPLASGDSMEIWSGFGIDFYGMGNSYQNYSFSFYNTIELEQVKPIQMSLSDITIYTGGNGYDGVVNSADGNTTAMDNGFPTPGFYITLPDELNEKLGSIQNLANIITLKYDNGQGDTREWNLSLYGTSDHSTDSGGYVYKFVTADGADNFVRIQLTTPDGQYILSDDFDVFVNQQYKEYQMAVYNGAIDANYVTAEVNVNGKVYTYPVEEGNAAKLTVRANIDEVHADVVANQETIPSGEFGVVASPDVAYYVNDKNVQVADDSGVRLMVDEILDDTVLVDHLKTNPEVTLPKGNLVFQQKYLDLVDTNNGDAYLTLGDGQSVTVYWPVPADYIENGAAVIYHFDGVDRDYNTGDVLGNVDQLVQIQPELVTVNGTRYFTFTTSSFSPFVLAYANSVEPETKPDSKPSEQTPVVSNPSVSTPVTSNSPVATPQTGDTSNVLWWAVLVFVAGAGLAGSIYVRKRRSSK